MKNYLGSSSEEDDQKPATKPTTTASSITCHVTKSPTFISTESQTVNRVQHMWAKAPSNLFHVTNHRDMSEDQKDEMKIGI